MSEIRDEVSDELPYGSKVPWCMTAATWRMESPWIDLLTFPCVQQFMKRPYPERFFHEILRALADDEMDKCAVKLGCAERGLEFMKFQKSAIEKKWANFYAERREMLEGFEPAPFTLVITVT
jgi:hypothetical protein